VPRTAAARCFGLVLLLLLLLLGALRFCTGKLLVLVKRCHTSRHLIMQQKSHNDSRVVFLEPEPDDCVDSAFVSKIGPLIKHAAFVFVIVPHRLWTQHIEVFSQLLRHVDSIYVAHTRNPRFVVVWKTERKCDVMSLVMPDVFVTDTWFPLFFANVEIMFPTVNQFTWYTCIERRLNTHMGTKWSTQLL